MKIDVAKSWSWRWGKMTYRLRWWVVIFWIVLFVGFVSFAAKTPGLLKDNGFTPYGSESEQGMQVLNEELGFPSSSITLVYQSPSLDLTSEPQKRRIMDSLASIKRSDYVLGIDFSHAARLENGSAGIQSVLISLNLNTDDALEKYPQIRKMISAPEGMDVHITGGTAVIHDLQQASKHDIAKAEMLGLPIALLVLLAIFGTILGALLPLVVGLLSVTITLGVTYFIAQQEISLSNFLPNMITMLGLAVGIDYALFIVSRFREELKRQQAVEEAVAVASETAGKAILFSGMAVLIGILGMFFIDLSLFHSFAIGGVLVVFISVLVANSLLLALLGLFGHRINSFQIIPAAWKTDRSEKAWGRIAYAVMKRPILLVSVLTILLLYLMMPLSGIKLGVSDAEVLPPSYESRLGWDLMNETYDRREMDPIHVAVRTQGGVWEKESIRGVQNFIKQVENLPDVKEVRAYTNVLGIPREEQAVQLLQQPEIQRQLEIQKLAKSRTALIEVIPQTDPDGSAVAKLVRNLRILEEGNLHSWVTGGPAYRLDIVDRINGPVPWVIFFVMGITYIILFIAFRSAVLPLKAVFMNVLSLGASLGIVVSVFQQGHFADWFQITSIGYVNAILPMIIFCVVFGISMDYEVFLISRIIEEYETTGDNEHSTAEGLKKTGSLITSAAFILVVVVGTFIFTDIEIMKALGLGLSLAVLIDATVIRIIVVPALMKLLGAANWWAPRWIKPHKP